MNLELEARVAWHIWGDGFAKFGRCSCCGELRYLRGKRRSWMLCLECFDVAADPDRRKVQDANGKEGHG